MMSLLEIVFLMRLFSGNKNSITLSTAETSTWALLYITNVLVRYQKILNDFIVIRFQESFYQKKGEFLAKIKPKREFSTKKSQGMRIFAKIFDTFLTPPPTV